MLVSFGIVAALLCSCFDGCDTHVCLFSNFVVEAAMSDCASYRSIAWLLYGVVFSYLLCL